MRSQSGVPYPILASSPCRLSPLVLKGVVQALPIVVGYIPLGFAYGVMAQNAGLPFFATLLMTALVLAASSQYVAVAMIAGNQPIPSIVFTTFIINLRHLLMSTTLASHVSRWSKIRRILFASELTDETFALHSTNFSKEPPRHPLQNIATNVTTHLGSILGSVLGYMTGSLMSDVKVLGLDFALSAMFIALLVMQIKSRLMVLVGLLAAALAIVLHIYSFNTWAIMVAAVFGATIGLLCELWNPGKSY